MYPIGSNGGSQAIVDARVLAFYLAGTNDPVAALAAYEAARRPATTAIVLANRAMGPEQILTLVETRAPQGFTQIEEVLSREELESIARDDKRTAGFPSTASQPLQVRSSSRSF